MLSLFFQNISSLQWTEEMQEYTKTYCLINDGCYLLMRSTGICTKKVCLYPKTVLRKRPKFWRKSKRHKLVKKSAMFWIIFDIIEFGFCMMWRIMQISEAVITFSLICIILHIILSLIIVTIFFSAVQLIRQTSLFLSFGSGLGDGFLMLLPVYATNLYKTIQ